MYTYKCLPFQFILHSMCYKNYFFFLRIFYSILYKEALRVFRIDRLENRLHTIFRITRSDLFSKITASICFECAAHAAPKMKIL